MIIQHVLETRPDGFNLRGYIHSGPYGSRAEVDRVDTCAAHLRYRLPGQSFRFSGPISVEDAISGSDYIGVRCEGCGAAVHDGKVQKIENWDSVDQTVDADAHYESLRDSAPKR